MTRTPLAILAAALLSAPALAAPRGHYCNLHVFSAAEWSRHQELTPLLAAAVTERVELPDGYAFRFLGKDARAAGEWLDGVRRCCPTLHFELSFEPEGGTAWLRATGTSGAKEFIREEFKLVFDGPAATKPAN